MNINIFLQRHIESLQHQDLNTGTQVCVKKTQNKQKKQPTNNNKLKTKQQQNKPTKINQPIKKKLKCT